MESTLANVSRRLIADLVTQITGLSRSSPQTYNQVLRRAIATATDSRYRPADRDDVRERLDGRNTDGAHIRLVEKCSVLARDDLADALAERIQLIFPVQNESVLSVLAMLLHLAQASALDKPVPQVITNYHLEPKEEIKWEDIIKDDPLEGEHWKNWEPGSSDLSSEDDEIEVVEESRPNDVKINITEVIERPSATGRGMLIM
ncbi:hypothetical protein LIPSTDRAFT_64259 [Lipomyces starkeyi NRRL Y-11557]|uniref:Gamma-Tubulin ring complex non-core subunit mod21 N-terminal domain-containing protein n=1 Tax=Lipomyces starkeyi NRRL Y-11557 TaxID=675824 RepID=A0A1E3Q390_LIPST|nr:hypothetical protein LIPSTDRAFT_64259 [Lipomyces starkeyi NRRL Y-11557]